MIDNDPDVRAWDVVALTTHRVVGRCNGESSMGAMPWKIVGPYDSDAEHALRLMQHQYFDEHYNLPTTIGEVIANARSCVEAVQDEDEYEATYSKSIACRTAA